MTLSQQEMADELDKKIGFTITFEGALAGRAPKHFSVEPGSKKPIRIGRAPNNDIQVELRGCSQYHAEIRVLAAKDEDSNPRLAVRDLSMNGTGIKRGEEEKPVQCKKDQDVPLYHENQILVPYQLKANQTPEDRAWLKCAFDDPEVGAPGDSEEANGEGKRKKDDSDEEEVDGDEGGDDDEEDGEKTRMQFVDLLMKTREISAGTTYEDAGEILSKKPQWKAVDENTRKECFEIFVEHLGSHSGSKKKKKEKDKDKKKKRKKGGSDDVEEEEGRAKKGKKEKRGRSGSRGRREKKKRARSGSS